MPRTHPSTRTRVSPIGLDFGRQSLRAAQLERRGGQWRVLRVAGWHRRASEAGPELPEGFCKRIARTLRQGGFRGRRIIAGLSIPDVELHPLDIPDRGELEDPGKFRDAVQWELGRVAGVATDDSISDYWRLPSSKFSRTSAIGVVAPTTSVDAAGRLARAVGLECDRIDATACGLARLGAIIHGVTPDGPKQVWSVLDVGFRAIRLVVAVGETPVLVRHLGRGGEQWTQSVAELLGLSQETADVHKRDHGIAVAQAPPPGGQRTGNSLSEIATMIYDCLRPDLENIAGEVERSYEYVLRCYPDKTVGGMLLVGGGADLKGLDHYLAGNLGIEVVTLREIVGRRGTGLAADASVRDSLNPFGCAIGLAVDPEAC